jgi:hypothetical protein
MSRSRDLVRRLSSSLIVALLGACGAATGVPVADGGPLGDSATGPDAPFLPDAPTCTPTRGAPVRLSYAPPGATPVDCFAPAMAGPGEVVTRSAAVVSVVDDATGSHVTLDHCSPAADCVPLLATLDVSAPGLTLASQLTAGQFVRVRWRMGTAYGLGGCAREVEISNLPSWDGAPNTIRTDDALILAAADGSTTSLPDAPFTLARESIGCVGTGPGCGDGPPETFALRFGASGESTLVGQGAHGLILIGGRGYQTTNHQSFISGACDDSGSFDWVVVATTGV